MTTVEKNQAEMGRRVDMITADITSMRRDMDSNQRRTEDSFASITKTLASISGVVQDVRDQGMKAAGELSAVREKAVNAAILADDAAKAAMETKAKWDAEHQGKPK
jgi:septation ring formation regulator EzrA